MKNTFKDDFGCSYKHSSVLTLCFSKHHLYPLLKERHQDKKIAYMLVEVSTVRSCKMAIQAVSVALTQLPWGMHSDVLPHCVILYA